MSLLLHFKLVSTLWRYAAPMELGQLAFYFLAPALFLLFALAIGIAAVVDRALICARWAAAGFTIAIVGLLLDTLRPAGDEWLRWLAVSMHWFVMLCAVQTFFSRWRLPAPRVSWIAFGVLVIALLPLFGSDAFPKLRFLSVQSGAAMILLPLLWSAIRQRRGGWVDAVILAAVILVLASYAGIIGFGAAQPAAQFDDVMRQRTALNMLFNVMMGMNGVLLGIVIIIALGADFVERQRLASQTDLLTGVGNRFALAEHLHNVERGHWQCAAVIAIDLDHFKKINDRWGHAVGDEVLRRVGARLRDLFAGHAQLLRIGGEEFLMMLPPAAAPAGSLLALSVREALAQIAYDDLAPDLVATASVGLAILLPDETVESAMRRADQAVYCAKASGRNRVIASSASDGLMTLRAVA